MEIILKLKATNCYRIRLTHIHTFFVVEEREFGLSDLKTWYTWFKYAGGFIFTFSAVVTLSIDRGFYDVTELW